MGGSSSLPHVGENSPVRGQCQASPTKGKMGQAGCEAGPHTLAHPHALFLCMSQMVSSWWILNTSRIGKVGDTGQGAGYGLAWG